MVGKYDFMQEIEAPLPELLAIETQFPANGIISLDKMAGFIEMFNNNLIIKLSNVKRIHAYSRVLSSWACARDIYMDLDKKPELYLRHPQSRN